MTREQMECVVFLLWPISMGILARLILWRFDAADAAERGAQ